MKYDIYIREAKKMPSFYRKAIAEYEKRLGHYCKLRCHIIRKSKEWETLLAKADGTEKRMVLPGNSPCTSEAFGEEIAKWERGGCKGFAIFVPDLIEESEEKGADETAKIRDLYAIEPLILSDFSMCAGLSGTVLCEQIYRGYRILHNHPYHK